MNNKGVVPVMMLFLLFVIAIIIISMMGGFGLAFSLFKGLTSIPPVAYIFLAVVIVLVLLKGVK